jgi:hypothetical protein
MFSDDGSAPSLSRRGFLRLAGGTGMAVIATGALFLADPIPARAAQHLWRWCARCQGIWFSGNGTRGSCPAGDILDGGHHSDRSGDYNLKYDSDGGAGQTPWRWCGKCQGLFFGNGGGGRCPAGGPVLGHLPFSEQTGVTSGIYRIETIANNDGPGGQRSWWYCYKCTGLFFSGNGSLGRCAASATHDPTRSGEYLLRGI